MSEYFVHNKERKIVRDYKRVFEAELKTINKRSELRLDMVNRRWVETNAKLEFCNKLLGIEEVD